MRKALYLMGILDEEDLDWIARQGSHIQVAKDEVLIREGEPVDAVFILLDGSLDVTAGGQKVARLLSGDIAGEISFVDSLPPSATVTAAQRSRVVAIPRQILRARLLTDAWFASRFFRAVAVFLADRLRNTTARLVGGEGEPAAGLDPDEIGSELMESASVAAVRFDRFLKSCD